MTEEQWPEEAPKNILIRMPNWLGDAVMATPVLEDVKRKWPEAKLTAMCTHPIATLLEHHPAIDDFLRFTRPNRWIHRKQHLAIIDAIRNGEYDLGILLTNSLSSAWWFWRGGVKHRLGFAANWRSWLLDKVIPFPEHKEIQHLVKTYKELLAPLGIPVSNTDPKLCVSHCEHEEAITILAKRGINCEEHTLVGVNPGAAYGSAKCWLPERFEAVTKGLLDDDPNCRVIYFGDQAGASLVHQICQHVPPDRVLNLAGKTSIRELIALIQCCNVLLTNDSGPMHIAAALRTPLLALFGSTNALKTGPYPEGKVIHKHVSCSPCYKRVCPIDFPCMKQIEVEEVLRELKAILKRAHAPTPS